MKFLIALALSAVCFSASAEPATEASIDELLTVTHAAQAIDMLKSNIVGGMRAGLNQAMQGKTLSKAQTAYLDQVPVKFQTMLNQTMKWSDLRPLMLQIYEENFTEKEVRAAINFYESPEGSAFITKMPVVNQRGQELMLQRMPDMMQQMKVQMTTALKEVQTIQ